MLPLRDVLSRGIDEWSVFEDRLVRLGKAGQIGSEVRSLLCQRCLRQRQPLDSRPESTGAVEDRVVLAESPGSFADSAIDRVQTGLDRCRDESRQLSSGPTRCLTVSGCTRESATRP